MTSSPPEADRAGRLRIAFVSDTFDEGLGGAMVSAGRFVRAMRARHEVRVVSAGAPNDPGRIPVPGFRLPIHEMKAMRFTAAIPRREILRRAFEGVDVVHLQLPFWLAFGAARMAREMRIPVVAAFHVQPENLLMNVGVRSERLASALYRFWVKRLYQRADAVVCPSRFAQEKLVRHGLTTPSFVVSNGAPRTVPRSRWTREPEYRDAFLVLAAGRFAIEKRHDVLFDALRLAKHTDRIRLVVAGDGPRKDELIRLARDLPHPTDIGYVSDERLARLYHTADLLVHCGEIELEGMVVLESLSCGLPALVADAPESAAVQFALGREFLFPPGDARALAERLDFWIEHPHALAVARERAEAQSRAYDFESCVERLEDVYRYVIGRRSGRGPAPSRSHD
jgi:glycosyltransferase involved in cell wall biosynthesis